MGPSPHRGVDFNYYVGPNGQSGINLLYAALRSPVTGVVENTGEGTVGRIAIRDANGFLHEILHTDTRHVSVGDPVAAGELIGTMGNTGTKDQHVHYQLWDPSGNRVNPTDFWDRQGPADPSKPVCPQGAGRIDIDPTTERPYIVPRDYEPSQDPVRRGSS